MEDTIKVADIDRILGLADQFIEDWQQDDPKDAREAKQEYDAIRPLLLRAPRLLRFVNQIARMKLESEFGSEVPPCEDWIATLNDLIEDAREAVIL